MGVRFACHACGKRLNIKTELAGRRGICPACSMRFRIPAYDTETSTPLESDDLISGIDSQSDALSDTSGGVAVRSQTSSISSQRTGAATARNHASGSAKTESSAIGATTNGPSNGHPANPNQPVSPEELLGGSTATWYVRPPSGGQYGPADGPTMGQWMKEGRVADAAMVWRDGWSDWRVAKDVIPVAVIASGVISSGADSSAGNLPSTSQGGGAVADPASGFADWKAKTELATNQPAIAAEADGSREISERSGPLTSNKKKRSQKRIGMSIVLGLIFIALVVALVAVLQR